MFCGVLLVPLGAMGLGYGGVKGYATAAAAIGLIVFGAWGVVAFYPRRHVNGSRSRRAR